jgi:hypothetical protein
MKLLTTNLYRSINELRLDGLAISLPTTAKGNPKTELSPGPSFRCLLDLARINQLPRSDELLEFDENLWVMIRTMTRNPQVIEQFFQIRDDDC